MPRRGRLNGKVVRQISSGSVIGEYEVRRVFKEDSEALVER